MTTRSTVSGVKPLWCKVFCRFRTWQGGSVPAFARPFPSCPPGAEFVLGARALGGVGVGGPRDHGRIQDVLDVWR
jgi:hypothetical protein